MRGRLDPDIEASILASLDIGPRKAVGYLPLYTIRKFLKRDPRELAEELRARGLSARVFHADECHIKSGALYAWDDAAVKRIVRTFNDDDVRPEASDLVRQISQEWFEVDHPIMPLVRELFARK